MTRKHFEAIARILAASSDRQVTARALCDVFAEINPRFDAVRFLAACGVAPAESDLAHDRDRDNRATGPSAEQTYRGQTSDDPREREQYGY